MLEERGYTHVWFVLSCVVRACIVCRWWSSKALYCTVFLYALRLGPLPLVLCKKAAYVKGSASLFPPTQHLHKLPPCGVSGQEGETAPTLEHAAECGAGADGPQWSGVHSQSPCEVGQSSVSVKGGREGGV